MDHDQSETESGIAMNVFHLDNLKASSSSRFTIVLILLLLGSNVLTLVPSMAWSQQTVAVQDDAKDEENDDEWDDEGWDDVEEDAQQAQDVFATWQTTERKVMGAKRFLLQQEFQVEIERVQSICELDSKQIKKIEIAAKGGVKKMLNEWKTESLQMFGFDRSGKERKSKPIKEKKYFDVSEIDSQTMQVAGDGFMSHAVNKTVSSNMFWIKTIKSTLNQSQYKTWETFISDQRKAKRKAMVKSNIETLNLKLGLTPEQKPAFANLVRPKMMKAKLEIVENVGRYYEPFLYYYYASKASDSQLKKILSEAQLQHWKMTVGPAKNYGSMFDDNNAVAQRAGGVGGGGIFGALVEAVGAVADAAEAVWGKQK